SPKTIRARSGAGTGHLRARPPSVQRTWRTHHLGGYSLILMSARSRSVHPDGLNGFAELGSYVRRSVLAPAIVAAWLLLLLFYPEILGRANHMSWGSGLVVAPVLAYAVLPILL